MPPPKLYEFSQFDFDHPKFGPDEIARVNPQRFEMQQLSGVVELDTENHGAVGFLDVTEDAFWCRGHFPGYAMMPGVIQCEAAAQLAGFYCRRQGLLGGDFVGFGGMNEVRFRLPVRPPCRLVLMVKTTRLRAGRRAEFDIQGFVDGRAVFSGNMIGVPIARTSGMADHSRVVEDAAARGVGDELPGV